MEFLMRLLAFLIVSGALAAASGSAAAPKAIAAPAVPPASDFPYDTVSTYQVAPETAEPESADSVTDSIAIRTGLDSAGTPAPNDPPKDSIRGAGADKTREEAVRDSLANALELNEKNVKARGSKVHREKEVSRVRLSRQDIQRVAAAQGDPLKVLGTLPGVTNQNDLSVRPFVRGGKAEETQILWDGIPLLQPYHFGTIYSIFNTESLESMTLYSGGFPVEAGNALSAALFMQARPAPLDSFRLFADLSFLRGNFYTGVPIIKNRLSASFSYQAFWYDWVVNRVWDLTDLIKSDSAFSESKQEFRRYLELPNFRDMQFGLNWVVNDKVRADYSGLVSRDGFHSRNPVHALLRERPRGLAALVQREQHTRRPPLGPAPGPGHHRQRGGGQPGARGTPALASPRKPGRGLEHGLPEARTGT